MWRLILSILLALAVGVGAAMIYGGARWKEGTDHLRARLFSARAPIAPAKQRPEGRSNDYRRRSNATFEPR